MSQIIMALDQGTTSSRTILFDENGIIVAEANASLDCHFPQSGWVEQVPEDIWSSQRETIEAALAQAKLSMKDINAVGITNQRESTIAWNRKTGEALGPAINWQCRRTADFCEELKAEGFDRVLRNKTGLVTDPYFSGTKMRWILENVPDARKQADRGNLCFGTVDSWLIWKLTGGRVHATEISNASRTLVFNINTCAWDDEILLRFGIPRETLPEVKPSSGVIAMVNPELFGGEAPIAGVAGDQQAALFGQACFEAGMAKNTYGTGCFMISNTGSEMVFSQHGLLTTIAWQIGDEVTYALEGSVFIAGALVQWLRDGLEFFKDASETQAMAESVSDSGGVFVVPAFVGLGAPHWDPYARGTIVGLTRDTNRNHIVRASLEAIAYQSAEVLRSIANDTGVELKELRIDGGAAANDFLCQFQADLLGMKVTRPKILETTAMGAAFLAGLAVGVWKDQTQIRKLWQEEKTFAANISREDANQKMDAWNRAVERSKGWIVP
ncbi:MAG TPA: glycerol kinase GlpK [Candidatus Lambdaproteobacteria bacterium]|nr:glycerol kinase GlpK [Candidatus Lambdaproteobacteria bacterium]